MPKNLNDLINLEITPKQEEIIVSDDGKAEIPFNLSLKTKLIRNNRLSLDIICVIDQSGSM